MINSSNKRNILDIRQYKIVYWGPGESGKTTNYLRLKEIYKDNAMNNGIQIATTDDRTLWSDSVFITFSSSINNILYYYIVQIMTCTGQERFLTTREYVLQGADGVVFVADSDPAKMAENKRSFNELLAFIKHKDIPYLIELNKQDLPMAISVDKFKKELNLPDDEYEEDGCKVVYAGSAIDQKDNMVDDIFKDLIIKILLKEIYTDEL
ncbi:MAG: ADP-ribosylation factor-like protein [Promethearchaeota archaeon]